MHSHGSVLEINIVGCISKRSWHLVRLTESLRSPVILDSLYLSRFKSGVHLSFTVFNEGNELDINLTASSDVSNCHLVYLNSGFATLYNNIASDVRLALLSSDEKAVGAACSELVPPDTGSTLGRLIKSLNVDSILQGLVYQVVDKP